MNLTPIYNRITLILIRSRFLMAEEAASDAVDSSIVDFSQAIDESWVA